VPIARSMPSTGRTVAKLRGSKLDSGQSDQGAGGFLWKTAN
jgi:hypothetical protein